MSVSWSPDGTRLTSGSLDKTVRIWEVATGKELSQLNVGSGVNSVHFNKSGDTVAAGCDNGTVQIIDVATAEVKRPLNVGYVLKSHLFTHRTFSQITLKIINTHPVERRVRSQITPFHTSHLFTNHTKNNKYTPTRPSTATLLH